ncbi:MAG: hypothetical protein JWO13_416 [Acidobacteriales bacterium]|nr:hypothetical protein [Terriglobales bacterium]
MDSLPRHAPAMHDVDQAAESILAYWTPERLANAKPIPMPILSAPSPAPYQRGDKRDINFIRIQNEFMSVQQDAVRVADINAAPYAAIGMLFFTNGGSDWSCTAFAVDKSVFFTAAHCFFNVKTRLWSQNVVFKMGWSLTQPGLAFPALKLVLPVGWLSGSLPNYDCDVAAGIVSGDMSTRGLISVEFNSATAGPITSIGYPGAPPYDGTAMMQTTGCNAKSPLVGTIGMNDNNMTPGSSGGPWMKSSQFGVATGLNSFSSPQYPAQMFSPIFGVQAAHVYLAATSGESWAFTNRYTGVNTSAGPGIVAVDGKFHVFFRDGNGNGILHISSENALEWAPDSTWSPKASWYIGLNCDDKPAAAILGEVLSLVARDHGGNGIMYATTRIAGGTFAMGYSGFNTSSAPGIVSVADRLHVFFRDGDGNGILHISSLDGIHWEGDGSWTPNNSGYIGLNCDDKPGAAVLNGVLCVVARDHNGNGIMFATTTVAGGNFRIGYTGFNTSSNPGIFAFNSKFHVFYRDGSGDGILHIASPDGINWSKVDPWYIGENCDDGPSPAVTNGLVCVVSQDAGGYGVMSSVCDTVIHK